MCWYRVNEMNIFSRHLLTTSYSESTIRTLENLLQANDVPYDIKVYDRTSPSIFNMDTRERSGALFQKPQLSYRYTVYVGKADFDLARSLLGKVH